MPTAYWARSGLMDEVRTDHPRMPARSVAGMGDRPTAMALYGGIVTALYRREKTGRGGEVRASLMGGGMWANSYLIQARLCGVTVPASAAARGIDHRSGQYLSHLGRPVLHAGGASERQWPALARAVGMPELATIPGSWDRRSGGSTHWLLMSMLDDAFARKPLAEWRAILDAAGLTFGVVGTVAEIVDRSPGSGKWFAASVRGNRNADGGQPVLPERSGKSPGRTGPRLRRA